MTEGQKLGGLPRPGPALKFVLGLLAAVSLVAAVIERWHVGGEAGTALLSLLPMAPDAPTWELWRLGTSGVLTLDLSHLFFSALGLYFLSTDLEKTMGKWRYLRFLLLSVVFGNVLAVAASIVAPPEYSIFHPRAMFGPGAAITATAIAWAKSNERMQVRLFFLIPVTGKQLYYATIGFCVLGVIYFQNVPEGVVAPFGGLLAGMMLSGQPSLARSAYLRVKLFFLRRQKHHVSAESLLRDPGAPRGGKRKAGGPELRVVMGGLEEKLKDPKDKRYLN